MVDKRQKFVDLAEKRVNRVIDDIRLVGNLANKHNYVYAEEDAQKITAALEAEVKLLKQKFAAGTADERHVFKL